MTGTIHITRTNDAEPVMDALKAYSDVLNKHRENVAGARLIGAIDPITAAVWKQECGAKIGSKEFAQYAKKKLKDPDYRKFRMEFS